jgi:DNA topoisomerase-2
MPIWSLTQERVDKITRQVGDKEMEIDELTKLSSKDLWNRDLDDFINEWHLQLDDESKRAKKIAGISRRASAKLGIGIKGAKKPKKRKAGSDSDDSGSDGDFAMPKKKPAVKAVMDRVKPKGASTLMTFFQQPEPLPPKAPKDAVTKPATSKPTTATASKTKPQIIASDDEDFMDIDNFHVEKEVVAVKKGKTVASKAKPKTVLSDDDDEDIFAAVAQEAKAKTSSEAAPSRAGRVKKPTKYIISDESDESFGEEQADPGDLSMMVKGIGASTAESARPLFSTTAQRPTSSHGLQKIMQKSKSRSVDSDDEIDDTNYEGLIPQDSPRRPAPRTANETFVSDDEDENDFPVTKPANKAKAKTNAISKITAKPAAKTVAKKPAAKKPAPAAVVKKIMPPSPAAKAYAAKQARLQAQSKLSLKKNASETASEDEETNEIANELLGDSDEDMEDAPVVARPGRRAASAAAAKTKKYVIDEDDDSDEASEEDSFGDDDDESD